MGRGGSEVDQSAEVEEEWDGDEKGEEDDEGGGGVVVVKMREDGKLGLEFVFDT